MTTDRAVTTAEIRKRLKDAVAKLDTLLAFGGTDEQYEAANKEAEELAALADAMEVAQGRPSIDDPEPTKA